MLVPNLEPFAAATLTDRTCAKVNGMMNERELDDMCRPLDAKNMLDAIIDILNWYYSQIDLKLGDVLWCKIFRNRSISPIRLGDQKLTRLYNSTEHVQQDAYFPSILM